MESDRIEINVSANERRLYERFRKRVIERQPGASSGIGDLLLLLPDCVVLLSRLARDPRVPPGAKIVAVAALGYVISPVDLLPEVVLGPVGLLDDLFVVGAGISFLLKRVHPDVVRAHWPGQDDALEALKGVTGWAGRQLWDGFFGMLGRIRALVR